jgi:hypothetical protein
LSAAKKKRVKKKNKSQYFHQGSFERTALGDDVFINLALAALVVRNCETLPLVKLVAHL